MNDYKNLLKSYIEHIKAWEGIDFLEPYYSATLTSKEREELTKISTSEQIGDAFERQQDSWGNTL